MAAFKLKSDTIAANFAKAAGFKREIDWAHYEANVSKSGFVADFKAQYEATEIPVPSDNGLEAQLEAKAAADEVAVADYIKKVDGQIADASVTLNNIKALPPFEQMTQADILYFFPQLCRNQESIFNSENCRHITLLGSRTGDLRMVDGIKWVLPRCLLSSAKSDLSRQAKLKLWSTCQTTNHSFPTTTRKNDILWIRIR